MDTLSLIRGALLLCSLSSTVVSAGESGVREPPRPPEVLLGDRLFRETRFAEYYAQRAGRNLNVVLQESDPAVEPIGLYTGGALPNPDRATSMSCRQCHLGDDFIRVRPLLGRTYADFSR